MILYHGSPNKYDVDDYWEYAIIAREYLKNPCGTYSIPYWKNKRIQIPDNMKILHDREFEEELLLEYNDEKYFRKVNQQASRMRYCRVGQRNKRRRAGVGSSATRISW